jgi:hypothetical protein
MDDAAEGVFVGAILMFAELDDAVAAEPPE